jgi:hypothetical protein
VAPLEAAAGGEAESPPGDATRAERTLLMAMHMVHFSLVVLLLVPLLVLAYTSSQSLLLLHKCHFSLVGSEIVL